MTVGIGRPIITDPVSPGIAVNVVVVTRSPVQVWVVVNVGTGMSTTIVAVPPGIAVTVELTVPIPVQV